MTIPGFSFLEPWAEISQRLRRFNVRLFTSINAFGVFGSLQLTVRRFRFTSIEVGEIKRIQKDPECEHDDEEVVFERQIQFEIALGVFRS